MLDIKFIRDNADKVKETIKNKQIDLDIGPAFGRGYQTARFTDGAGKPAGGQKPGFQRNS